MTETSQSTIKEGSVLKCSSGPASPQAIPADLPDDIDAIAHARGVVKQSGTSFGPGMRILSVDRRNAMFAVYAFCREIDDIADEDGTRDEKITALAEWREEIDRLYTGAPKSLTGRALLKPVRQFDLPKAEFILLIEGMEMDANGPIQAPTFEQYLAYCRRVAGAVGMLSMPIFGAAPGSYQDKFAIALANALQTTNILRDVAEDCEINRIYLPKELLEKHGITKACPDSLLSQVGLTDACAELGEHAKNFFIEAREALGHFDWHTVRPALLMMGIYETYWRKLKENGFDPNRPVAMSKLEKAAIALRYLVAPPLRGSGALKVTKRDKPRA